jgi:hypothetical protein
MSFRTREKWQLIAGGAVAAMLTAGALAISVASANTAAVGEAAPAFAEQNTAGTPVSLADFEGKTVVLEWTNHGCPFVKKHYDSGNMQATQQAAIDEGAIWISVISSKPGSQGHVKSAEADKLTKDRKAVPHHVLLDPDGSMGRAYGAKTTPHIYVITPDQKLAYNGAIDSIPSSRTADIEKAKNYAINAVKAVKAGQTPDPSLTVPYGCDVKY